jgi:hypothetical protein
MTALLRPVTVTAITSALAFGVLMSLFGTLKLTLSRSIDIKNGGVRGLARALNFALIILMIVAGCLIDNFGVQPLIVTCAALAALSMFALSNTGSAVQGFGALLMGGLAAAGLCLGSIMLMSEAFFPQKPLASVVLGFVLFALGALVAPPLVDVLARLIGSKRAIMLLSIAALIPGVCAFIAMPGDARADGGDGEEFMLLMPQVSTWFACAVYAFYAPLEAAISSWADKYLTDSTPSEGRASRLLFGFWAAFIGSRVLVGALLYSEYIRAEWEGWVLVVPPLLAAVVLGNMSGTVGTERARLGLLLLGLCLGPIAPMLFGMLLLRPDLSAARNQATAMGLVFAAGSLGSLLFLPVLALANRSKTPQTALRVLMLTALVLSGSALFFVLQA